MRFYGLSSWRIPHVSEFDSPGLEERRIVRYLPFPTRLTVNTKPRYILCRDENRFGRLVECKRRRRRKERENKELLYCFHHIVSSSILIYLHWYDSVYIQLWPTKWPWHKHEKSFQYTRLYSSSCRQDKRCQFFSNEIRFCQHRRCHPEDRNCIIIITMFDCSVFFSFSFSFPLIHSKTQSPTILRIWSESSFVVRSWRHCLQITTNFDGIFFAVSVLSFSILCPFTTHQTYTRKGERNYSKHSIDWKVDLLVKYV